MKDLDLGYGFGTPSSAYRGVERHEGSEKWEAGACGRHEVRDQEAIRKGL